MNMKNIFLTIMLLSAFTSLQVNAQEAVTNKDGKEITVNAPATTSSRGQVKLAGDLAGTADAPTVPALSNKVEGSGTLNYIPKFTAGKILGNSQLFDNGTGVGIGTTSPGNTLEINQGTAGNSGLRFSNLTSSSTASTSSSKVLGLNSSGDVILTNVPGTQNIVAFSVNANPNTAGTTFDPNTPNDPSVVYQSTVDNSMWTYNGSTYVTYTAPASTAWYTSGTTNDAGNSKTSTIYRTGGIVTGGSSTSPIYGNVTAIGGTNFTGVPAYGVASIGKISNSTAAWIGNGFLFSNSTAGSNAFSMVYNSDKAFFGHITPTNAVANYGAWNSTGLILGSSGNPTNRLDVVGAAAIGSYAGVDTAPSNGLIVSGNVGIKTASPSAPLVVQGITGTGAIKLIAPSVAAGDNWWMGFGHGTTSTDANDRARVGVDIVGGGSGRLFFTTGAAGSQARAMFIDESQKVGIGTSTPNSKLEVASTLSEVARLSTSLTTTNYASLGIGNASGAWGKIAAGDSKLQIRNYSTDASVFHADLVSGNIGIGNTAPSTRLHVQAGSAATNTVNADAQVFRLSRTGTSNVKWDNIAQFNLGSYSTSINATSRLDLALTNGNDNTTLSNVMTWQANGNVGVGTTAPGSKLEVNGSATNTTAFNLGSATAVTFNMSNLAYTTANPGAFNLQGMKDGGTYTLAVQGTTAALSSFSGLNPAGTAFTFLSANNAITMSGKQTLYTFIVMGNTVYYYMATGF